MLAGRIGALCADLLPDGRKQVHEWVAPSRWGGSARSLSVHLVGPKAGVWRDFATGDKGGDALDLVAEVLHGGDKARAIRWARTWLGIDSGDPATMQAAARQAQVSQQRQAAASAEQEERFRRKALALWRDGVPIRGTPADAYLRGRGIDLAALPRVPSALRFHGRAWNTERGTELPAMLALIQGTDGRQLAVHRTWIEPHPDVPGGWRKARLRDAKKTLATYAGGWIPLTRGASGRRWAEARPDETVALAEGIENALSVAVLVPEWRVAATVSVANMGKIKMPASIRDVVVCADNDARNSAAVAAWTAAVNHLLAQGCQVRSERPDVGVKDWNDQLRAEQQA